MAKYDSVKEQVGNIPAWIQTYRALEHGFAKG